MHQPPAVNESAERNRRRSKKRIHRCEYVYAKNLRKLGSFKIVRKRGRLKKKKKRIAAARERVYNESAYTFTDNETYSMHMRGGKEKRKILLKTARLTLTRAEYFKLTRADFSALEKKKKLLTASYESLTLHFPERKFPQLKICVIVAKLKRKKFSAG